MGAANSPRLRSDWKPRCFRCLYSAAVVRGTRGARTARRSLSDPCRRCPRRCLRLALSRLEKSCPRNATAWRPLKGVNETDHLSEILIPVRCFGLQIMSNQGFKLQLRIFSGQNWSEDTNKPRHGIYNAVCFLPAARDGHFLKHGTIVN